MAEGFWIVQYEGMQGNGGGVAVFIKGKVFGGDTGYTYMGSYRVEGNSVKTNVMVRNFLPGVACGRLRDEHSWETRRRCHQRNGKSSELAGSRYRCEAHEESEPALVRLCSLLLHHLWCYWGACR